MNAFTVLSCKSRLYLPAPIWLSASAVTLMCEGCRLRVSLLGDSSAVMVTTIYRESTRARPFTFIILFNPHGNHWWGRYHYSILPLEIGNVAWLTQDHKIVSGDLDGLMEYPGALYCPGYHPCLSWSLIFLIFRDALPSMKQGGASIFLWAIEC